MSTKAIRILALDGAGVRSVMSMTVMEQIEKATGKPIHELFDIVVGTSAGGAMAIYLTIPCKDGRIMDVSEMRLRAAAHIQRIYSNGWAGWNNCRKFLYILAVILTAGLIIPILYLYHRFLTVKYTAKEAERFLSEHYNDDATLKDAVTSVGVVTTDMIYGDPLLLNSLRAKLYNDDYRHNAKLVDVLKATAALPILFSAVLLKDRNHDRCKPRRSISCFTTEEPEYMRDKITLEDGSVTANNPSYLGYKYARTYLRALGEDHESYQFQVVSIGTGTQTGHLWDPPEYHKNLVNQSGSSATTMKRLMSKYVFRIAVRGYEVHHRMVSKMGGEGPGTNYFRAQFKVSLHQLNHRDDVSKKNVKSLIESAERYLYSDVSQREYSEHFKGIIDLLKRGDIVRPPKPNLDVIERIKVNEDLKRNRSNFQNVDGGNG